MHEFNFESIETLDETLARVDNTHRILAGGTDLLTRLKSGLDQPESLLDIKATDLQSDLSVNENGVVMGALCTLSDIESADALDSRYQLLKDAAGQAATQQIRNRATIAGNLLQAPRCWYYRHPDIDCWRKGGDECPAKQGRNSHHAVIGEGPCVAVHPSDLAACLLTLDAAVDVRSRRGERRLDIADFLCSPTQDRRQETALEADEIITSISIPPLSPSARSCYLKAMDRKTWAFALSGLAAAVTMQDGQVQDVRLSLSGVANTPYRLTAVEALLKARRPDADLVQEAVARSTEDFSPLSENGYKVELVQGLMKSALGELLLDQ